MPQKWKNCTDRDQNNSAFQSFQLLSKKKINIIFIGAMDSGDT